MLKSDMLEQATSTNDSASGYGAFNYLVRIPQRWRATLVILSFAIYIGLAIYFFDRWGFGVGMWGTIAVVVGGFMFGVRGGLFSGLAVILINNLIFASLGGSGFLAIWRSGGLIGQIMTVAIGLAVGWLQTISVQLGEEVERRRAIESALRDSEEQLRQMFANNQAVKLLIDPANGRIADANPAAVEFYGYSLAQLRRMSISDINTLSPEDVVQEMTRAVQAERSYFLSQHRLASGELRHVEVYSSPAQIGGRTLLYSIIHDITERTQAEAALLESERQYRSLIQQSNDAIYLLVNERFALINAQFSQMFGVTPEEARRPDFNMMDLVAPESVPLIAERSRRIAAGDALPGRYEFMGLSSDGRLIPVEASVSYVEYQGLQATQGILRDITERYEAQETLRQSEEYFRALIEKALDIITVINVNGTIRYQSPSVERALGYRPEEMVGHNILKFIHPDDRDIASGIFWSPLQANNSDKTYEFRAQNKAGEWRVLEATGRFSPDSSAVEGIVVNSRDVTERRLTEETLRRRAGELEALAEVSAELRLANDVDDIVPIILKRTELMGPDTLSAIFLLDPETGDLAARGRHPDKNKWIGWRQASDRGIVGHVIRTGEMYVGGNLLTDPLSAMHYTEFTQFQEAHSNIFLPLQAQRQTIGLIHVGLRQRRPFTPEEIRLLAALAEITGSAIDRALVLETLEQRVAERTQELAEANEGLKQLDNLKSKFVSDVSHELRTPVANLNLYLDLLQRGRENKRMGYMAVLREQTERLTQLIEDILDLTRLELNRQETPWSLIELNGLIQQVLIAHALRAEALGLELQFVPQADLPLMQGDPNQIVQVITNLISNALNYTPAGQVCVQSGYDLQKNQLFLEVTDSGLGIDDADLPHLFERFYRGKWVSQSAIPGTGLGLAIVKEIVDHHGGEIEVSSAPGQGTTFRVWWPAVTAGETTSNGAN